MNIDSIADGVANSPDPSQEVKLYKFSMSASEYNRLQDAVARKVPSFVRDGESMTQTLENGEFNKGVQQSGTKLSKTMEDYIVQTNRSLTRFTATKDGIDSKDPEVVDNIMRIQGYTKPEPIHNSNWFPGQIGIDPSSNSTFTVDDSDIPDNQRYPENRSPPGDSPEANSNDFLTSLMEILALLGASLLPLGIGIVIIIVLVIYFTKK